MAIPRRTLLRGLGASLALPWLESVARVGLAANEPATAAMTPPRRLAVLFFGNGVCVSDWWAKGAGAAMELGSELEPLAAHRSRLTVIDGLYNEQAGKGSIHSAQTGNVLSGAVVRGGGSPRTGISLDQILAQAQGHRTVIPSLAMGCERPAFGIHKGYSEVYSSHISWVAPSVPVPLERFPAQIFDTLFGKERLGRDLGVLDAVRDELKELERSISAADRQRLDEYATSVQELEQRIERMRQPVAYEGWRPTRDEPDLARPEAGIPTDLPAYHQVMGDLLVNAFQTDRTRIATLMLNRDLSAMLFPHLGQAKESHHSLSHKSHSPAYSTVTRYLVGQYARILDRLAAIDEGGTSLLDSSAILLCSSIWNGSGHDCSRMPMLVAGSLGGRFRTGRVLDYTTAGDDRRRACNLYTSLLRHCDVPIERFGDASGPLSGF